MLAKTRRVICWTCAIVPASAVCADPLDDKSVIDTEQAWIPNGFRIARSDHFLLAHDSDAATAQARLGWMESTYDCVIKFLRDANMPISPPTKPLQAIAARDPTNIARVKQITVRSGYYDHSSKRSYFGLPPTEDTNDDRAKLLAVMAKLTVRHETAHQVLDATCPELFSQLPPQISEGLACLFECPDAACIRYPNPWRAKDLLESLNGASDGDPAAALLRLMMTDRMTVAGNGELSQAAYSRAWALMAYLVDQRRPDLDMFLHAVIAPSDVHRLGPYSAFRAFIGPIDRTLAENILTFVRRSIAPPEKP